MKKKISNKKRANNRKKELDQLMLVLNIINTVLSIAQFLKLLANLK